MKRTIVAALLIGSAATAQAQELVRDNAVQMQQMQRMQAGQAFAQTLVQNAVTGGKTAEVLLTYDGTKGWACSVRVTTPKAAPVRVIVADGDASPERACVRAVLILARDKAL